MKYSHRNLFSGQSALSWYTHCTTAGAAERTTIASLVAISVL